MLTQLLLTASACFAFAPTEKNSVITSNGMPLVSGTFKKTNTQATMHTTAYIPKTPPRPTELSITGSVQVTMMSHIQNVRAHIAMHRPRTRVGKISEQRILGIGPKPMTKQQKQTMTLKVEMKAFTPLLKSIRLPTTNIRRDATKTGIVVSSKVLNQEKNQKKVMGKYAESVKKTKQNNSANIKYKRKQSLQELSYRNLNAKGKRQNTKQNSTSTTTKPYSLG